jgi:serine/threonine-protein kinase
MNPAQVRSYIFGRAAQILLAVAVASLFIFFLFDRMIMPLYTRQGSERKVPQLTGLDTVRARALAESLRFEFVVENAKIGGKVAPGTILEQRPLAGNYAKPGRKIHVVPTSAVAPDVTPDLLGLEVRDAQLRCRNSGLICSDTEISYKFSDKSPRGLVAEQTPRPGKSIEPGSTVKIIVSMGPQPERFFVPNLADQALSDALVMLREAGLKLGKIIRRETGLFPPGVVMSQSVRAGQEVNNGDTIDLVVATQSRTVDGAE